MEDGAFGGGQGLGGGRLSAEEGVLVVEGGGALVVNQ